MFGEGSAWISLETSLRNSWALLLVEDEGNILDLTLRSLVSGAQGSKVWTVEVLELSKSAVAASKRGVGEEGGVELGEEMMLKSSNGSFSRRSLRSLQSESDSCIRVLRPGW